MLYQSIRFWLRFSVVLLFRSLLISLRNYTTDSFVHSEVIMCNDFEKKQKQSFATVLHNRCSQKFLKFHRKAPVLEPLFKNNFMKKRSQHGVLL